MRLSVFAISFLTLILILGTTTNSRVFAAADNETSTTVDKPKEETKTQSETPLPSPDTKVSKQADEVKPKLVDDSCTFFPEQAKCVPDEGQTDCPPGFFTNEDGHCFKGGKCPDGFFRQDDDESGTCLPRDKDSPKILCPEGIITKNCVEHCPGGTHAEHFLCLDNKNNNDNHKIVIHKTIQHITSNNNPSSFVTRNTQLTDDLTVGQAIDGCKDLTKKSPDNELKKSCNIFMAALFNYCLTHTKIANKDNNICSDDLYLTNVPQYVKENVDLKLFPSTIYNVVP